MVEHNPKKFTSAIHITFAGNCKKALTFYQSCFGGLLQFEMLEIELGGSVQRPVVSGSLVSDKIVIHGSDLVHQEGRQLGNYMSIFLSFGNADERNVLIEQFKLGHRHLYKGENNQALIEVTDAYDVRWILGISQT